MIEISAIIAAAGVGARFGGLKQFYRFRRRPFIHYCLAAFHRHPRIKRIFLVVPERAIPYTINLVEANRFRKVAAVVPGGKRRQDSVRNGFRLIPRTDSIVIIHDGARPFVPPGVIDHGIAVCRAYGAVICGIPVSDTIKRAQKGRIVETVDRNGLFLIQTPQFFKRVLLERAYRNVDFTRAFTDEAAMVEAAGGTVRIIRGDKRNIKVTDRSDIAALKSII